MTFSKNVQIKADVIYCITKHFHFLFFFFFILMFLMEILCSSRR